jgi:hypothetical protein
MRAVLDLLRAGKSDQICTVKMLELADTALAQGNYVLAGMAFEAADCSLRLKAKVRKAQSKKRSRSS